MGLKKKNDIMFVIVIATTILGQVYAKPFGTDFRISIGIIALSVLLLRFEKVSIIWTCGLTGFSIFLFRVILDYLPQTIDIWDLILVHFPAALFYIFFGMILTLLKFRETVSKPVVCLLVIAIADVSANTFELIIRGDFRAIEPEIMSVSVVLTGVIRATISYILYLSEKFYTLLIIGKEQREKYKEFVMMRANIKSEIFFMQKSMDDIEDSMKESFALYRLLNTEDTLSQKEIKMLKYRILGISKGIHEIKKDYSRIITGMGNVVPDVGFTKYKNSDEIFEILKDVTEKYIVKTGKDIDFNIDVDHEFPIFYYSPLLSVLNNLIINAIDAIESKGWVMLRVDDQEDKIRFRVSDNGSGIKEKNLEAIFTPGFSTKFDPSTGKMSTGIGLTHVKHIVERSLEGSISIESMPYKMTRFTVLVSKKILCVGDNNE
ncbi:MAG: sensor histidine kinase [Clostridiales bacterium]|nr:sensor histidine kinase [Clostridiales bacterium]